MVRLLLALGLLCPALLLLQGLSSCQQVRTSQSQGAGKAAADSGGKELSLSAPGAEVQADTRPSSVTMPDDWPLPALTPPPGTRDASMPCSAPRGYGNEHMIRELPFNIGTSQEGRLWRVGFSYDRGPDIAMRHLEDCLKPLGYYLYWSEEGRGRELISPDGRYIAQIYYWPDEQVYHLQVSVYKEPWSRSKSSPRNS